MVATPWTWPDFGVMATNVGAALNYVFTTNGIEYGLSVAVAGYLTGVGNALLASTTAPFVGGAVTVIGLQTLNAAFGKGLADNFPSAKLAS